MPDFSQRRLHDFATRHPHRARLLIACPDRRGIVAAVTAALLECEANIVESTQYSTDHEEGTFFLRIEFESERVTRDRAVFEAAFAPVAERFAMRWTLHFSADVRKVALFVSKEDHCLLELLWAWQSGDLAAEIAFVLGNHETLRATVETFDIPFHHVPITRETKAQAEAEQVRLIREHGIDVIVLARYMQVLSPEFVETFPARIINIHHSFLPAFVGARPYEQAYRRGVKLIGATSHYVTNDLDEGPIIEQGVQRVDHRHNVDDLKRMGRTVEKGVLLRALQWHLEDRVLIHQNKTIVFA